MGDKFFENTKQKQMFENWTKKKSKTRQHTHYTQTHDNQEHEKVHLVKFEGHKSSWVWNSISFQFHYFSFFTFWLLIEHNEFELMWMNEETAESIHFENVWWVCDVRVHLKRCIIFRSYRLWCISWAKINKDICQKIFAQSRLWRWRQRKYLAGKTFFVVVCSIAKKNV